MHGLKHAWTKLTKTSAVQQLGVPCRETARCRPGSAQRVPPAAACRQSASLSRNQTSCSPSCLKLQAISLARSGMLVLGLRAWLELLLAFHMLMPAVRADACHAASVSVGDDYSCALLTDKSVRCWGRNDTGVLGRNSSSTADDPSGPPLNFGAQRSVIQLAAYAGSACALLDDGSVACWGANSHGEFGTNDSQTIWWQPTLMQLGPGNASVERITTGGTSHQTCAALKGAGITCWGWAVKLRGTPWVNQSRSAITDVAMPPGFVDLGLDGSQLPTVVDMCVGGSHTCILTVQQGLQCWGVAKYGQLGLGSITNTTGLTGAQLRVNLGNGRTAVQVSCGARHTCAVLDDGTLKCWGSNEQGQLGYNDTTSRGASDQDMGDNLPTVYLGAGRTVKQVAAGGLSTCAILDNGDLKCWGDNSIGQLGEFNCSIATWGDQPNQMGDNLPAINLGPNRTATSVAGGWKAHTCASLDDGSVNCWGNNANGELGLGKAFPNSCLPSTAVDLGSSCASSSVAANNNSGSNNGTSPAPSPAHPPSSPLPSPPPKPSPPPSPVRDFAATSATSPPPSSHSVSVGAIVGPVVAVVVAVALAAVGVWWWRTRKRRSSFAGVAAGAAGAGAKKQSSQVVLIASNEGILEEHSLMNAAAGGRQTPGYHGAPTSSTDSSKVDGKAGSSSSHPSAGAAFMSEGTFEDMRIPWSHITIGRVLGEGGFGTVYKAKWRSETVAVKLLNVCKTSKAAIHNLYQEALIMSRLRHPCVARVYGVVDEQQHHALVMQYYPQGTLAQYMATDAYAGMELATKIHIARQIAGGMLFMHERAVPILHGDLKAANILLTGPGKQVAIADFGLSQVMLAGQGAAVASGALTYSISPPEVLDDPLGPRTRAADVYAFAIVLLEIFIGKRAFGNLWPEDIKMMVTTGGRPALPADMPSRVSALIQACWAQDPVTRPAFAWVTEQLTAAYEELHLTRVVEGTIAGSTKAVDVTHTMTDW